MTKLCALYISLYAIYITIVRYPKYSLNDIRLERASLLVSLLAKKDRIK